MAVIYPLDVPLEEFSEVDIEAISIASVQESTFTAQDRVQVFEGDYWSVLLRYRDLDRILAQQVNAFVWSLRQAEGTFILSFPGYAEPLGRASIIPSTPLVDGAGQPGRRQISIKNAPVSVEGWLDPGDIIQIGPDTRPHWHAVQTGVDVDATGRAVIDIWPAVRKDVVNNDIIITSSPKCLFRLKDAPLNRITPPVIHSLALSCREVTG